MALRYFEKITPLGAPVRGRRPQDAALSARCGSFQPGRTKWQVYPLGYFSR